MAFVSYIGLNAQTNQPDAFVYKGLAKNPSSGGIATNTNVRLKVQVLKGGPKGPKVFEENHATTTNSDGIFSKAGLQISRTLNREKVLTVTKECLLHILDMEPLHAVLLPVIQEEKEGDAPLLL